jgi:hypothetical protein
MESDRSILCGFPLGKFRFLPSLLRWNTLCEPREMDSAVLKVQYERHGPPETSRNGGSCLEQREHIRYRVRAHVDFEWMDEGVLRRGRGLTRDISSKGMFIYSDSEPPPKADLRVNVSFRSVAPTLTKAQLRANSLVLRVEPPSSPGADHGFAVLNRSYELHDGQSSLEDREAGLDIEPN